MLTIKSRLTKLHVSSFSLSWAKTPYRFQHRVLSDSGDKSVLWILSVSYPCRASQTLFPCIFQNCTFKKLLQCHYIYTGHWRYVVGAACQYNRPNFFDWEIFTFFKGVFKYYLHIFFFYIYQLKENLFLSTATFLLPCSFSFSFSFWEERIKCN